LVVSVLPIFAAAGAFAQTHGLGGATNSVPVCVGELTDSILDVIYEDDFVDAIRVYEAYGLIDTNGNGIPEFGIDQRVPAMGNLPITDIPGLLDGSGLPANVCPTLDDPMGDPLDPANWIFPVLMGDTATEWDDAGFTDLVLPCPYPGFPAPALDGEFQVRQNEYVAQASDVGELMCATQGVAAHRRRRISGTRQ
jgi:hypothetical protein